MERQMQASSPESWKQPPKACSVVTKRKGCSQRLTKATSVNCLNKVTSTPTVLCRPLFFRTPPPSRKRSISLQDLSPAKLLGGSTFPMQDVPQDGEILEREARISPKTREYLMKAYARFLTAAWRSCRESVNQKNEVLALQLSQIKNLQMQSSSMKSLLEADVRMISDYCKEIRTLTQKVQELETENLHFRTNYEEILFLKKAIESHAKCHESFLKKTDEDLRRIENKLEETQRNRDELGKIFAKMEAGHKKLSEEKEALLKNLKTSGSKIVYLEECLNSKMMKIIELNSTLDAKCKYQWVSGSLKKINAILKVPLTIMRLIHNATVYF